MELVTGGQGKAHIKSVDAGAFNSGIFGNGGVVLNTLTTFQAEIIDNNTVRINAGDLSNQGRHMRIRHGTYEDLTVADGISGQKRHDLIVARYQMGSDGKETAALAVIKGTSSTGTPADPEYTIGDTLKGALKDEFPLYRVRLNGTTIEGLDKLFDVAENLIDKELAKKFLGYRLIRLESEILTDIQQSTTYSVHFSFEEQDFDDCVILGGCIVETGTYNQGELRVVDVTSPDRYHTSIDEATGKIDSLTFKWDSPDNLLLPDNIKGYAYILVKTVDIAEEGGNGTLTPGGGGTTGGGDSGGDSGGSTNGESYNIYLKDTSVDVTGNMDSTNALETLLNSKENVRYILQDGEKISISRPIKVKQNGIILDLCTTGTVRVADNSGINDYLYEQEFPQIPALINLFGDGCKIKGGCIDGNVWNNGITLNGSSYYTSLGDVDGIHRFGYNAVNMCGSFGTVDGCEIKNVSWAGVIISPYTETFGYGNTRSKKNVVRNCTISGTVRDGIATHLTDDVIIEGNYLYDNYWHDIHAYVNTKGCLIYKNKIEYKTKLDTTKWYAACSFDKTTCILLSHRQYPDSVVEDIDIKENNIDAIINCIYIIRCAKNIRIYENQLRTGAKTDSDVIIDTEVINGNLEIYSNKMSGCYYAVRFKHNDSITLDNNTDICKFNMLIRDNYIMDCIKGIYITLRTDTNDPTKPVGNVFTDSNIQIVRNAFFNSGDGENCILWGYGSGIKTLTTKVYDNAGCGYESVYPYGEVNTVNAITLTDATTGLSMTFVRNGDYISANMGAKPKVSLTADTDYVFSAKLSSELQPRREIYRYTEVRAGRAVRTKIATDGTVTVSTDFDVGTSTYALTDFVYLAKNNN